MSRRWRAGLLLLALASALALLLALKPPCLILKYTGFYCAGCGVQRMLSALLRGDLAGAAAQNLFMLLFLPAAGAYLLAEAWRYGAGKRLLCRSRAFAPLLVGILLLAGAFTVLRNLPAYAWLAPKSL